MSPEQARGSAVDKRTDIWAFGCVLFESGKQAFGGDNVTDVLAAVVNKEPEWSALPDPPATHTDVAVACDYGTDHTYKLSPQRLVWAIRKLGLIGEINHYVSVFWWNQRKRSGGFFPSVTVAYGGTWAGGDQAFLTIGGTTIGKSVFPADTPSTIAAHFAYYINEVFVGVWAQASGGVLTITVRSPAPAYSFSFSESHTSTNGTVTVSGSLTGGVMGNWVIDDTVT
jgi:hypothetical protein